MTSPAARLGYFFCQVFPSESIVLSGVPDVPVLEDLSDRGKVTDLQNDVLAEFGEPPGAPKTTVVVETNKLNSPHVTGDFGTLGCWKS